MADTPATFAIARNPDEESSFPTGPPFTPEQVKSFAVAVVPEGEL